MIMFHRLTEFIFSLGIRYLQWLSEPPIDTFELPHLSLIIIGSWLILLFLWFIGQALQTSEVSKSNLLLILLRQATIIALFLFAISVFLAIFIVYLQHTDTNWLKQWIIHFLAKPLILVVLCLAGVSLIFGWLSVRYWLPKINHWLNERITKKSYQDSGISDIRNIDELIPKTFDYDPTRYWKLSKMQMFIGLDPNLKPIYISLSEWKTQHQQVLGTTGFGKGVSVTNQLSQCLGFGQTVIVFDPKHDEWAPSVLIQTARQLGKPVCIIDLNANQAQFNPLFGADEFELFDLLVGAFGLAERGAESDYYRSKERRVVKHWIEPLKKGISLTEFAKALTEADFDNAPKLCNDLTELSMLGCINTAQKGIWQDVMDQGGLIYIIGSVRREPVLRLQKMLLLRILQRLEQRNRSLTHNHVTIFLDELKYLLCKPSLQALGTIRDKFANIILAHQSINDLRDVSDDLDPEAVKSAVLENTALKLIYRSQDPETAEWIAKRSGTIKAHREIRELTRNEGFSEMTHGNRRLQEMQRYLIEPNMILRLPKQCGIWFSNEPAEIVLTSPIQTSKINIKPTEIGSEREVEGKKPDFKSNGLDYFT